MITRLSVAPTTEPVTLTEAKLHLRLATTAILAAAYTTEDDLLNALIKTARGHAETYTNRALITQTWLGYLDTFPSVLQMPYPPFRSVSSIVVEDTAFTSFSQSIDGILTPTLSWPLLSASPGPDPIVITFLVGYGSASDVPQQIKQAILLTLAHFYANREPVVMGVSAVALPFAVDTLLNPFRCLEVP